MQNLDNMKIFFQKIIFSLLLVTVLLIPAISYSAVTVSGIVSECTNGLPGECTFADLISAVRTVINWGTIFALQFSVVVIAFAGFRYMKSGDNAGERTKANEMLRKVVYGIFFILTAWVLVTLITGVLLKGGIDTFLG